MPRPKQATSAVAVATDDVGLADGDAMADAPTRQRVLEATVQCIVELGYYQATSNEIARRAGVTWGVIQYYFGSRERLLVAVIEDACARAIDALNQTKIEGDTVADRLDAWVSSVYSFFSQPGYTAVLQILWDVLRRPGTAAESKAAMLKYQADVQASYYSLLPQVAKNCPLEVAELVYAATWGLALSEATAPSYADVFGVPRLNRRAFVEALAWLIERESADGKRRPRLPSGPKRAARKTTR